MKMGRHAGMALRLAFFAAAVYVGLRWLLPWFLPFLLAFVLAAAIEPLVGRLCRKGVKREIAAGLCVLIALAALTGVLWLLLHRTAAELRGLVQQLPELAASVSATLELWKDRLLALCKRAPAGMDVWLERALAALQEQLLQFPASLSARLPAWLSAAAGAAPGALLFTVTAVIGFYFTSASYPSLLHAFARMLPEEALARARIMRRDLRRTLGRWVKAQLMLLLFTFAELTVAFLLLKTEYALLLALGIALIDALPVLGAGTVLLPWALYDFLTGATPQAIGLAVTYVAVTVLRNSIQPKLIGDQLGLPPLVSLASIYVGWKVCGVIGMLTFPILAISGKQLIDSGVLRRAYYA